MVFFKILNNMVVRALLDPKKNNNNLNYKMKSIIFFANRSLLNLSIKFGVINKNYFLFCLLDYIYTYHNFKIFLYVHTMMIDKIRRARDKSIDMTKVSKI